ncbi:MAG: YciI family protein [Micropepsaceae bacterium]
MPLFVVTYTHPNEDGWNAQVLAHVHYFQELLKTGALLASGPFVGGPVKSAMLVMPAANREALLATIAKDPFAIHGLIEDMTVTEWDPIFGALIQHSSRGAG